MTWLASLTLGHTRKKMNKYRFVRNYSFYYEEVHLWESTYIRAANFMMGSSSVINTSLNWKLPRELNHMLGAASYYLNICCVIICLQGLSRESHGLANFSYYSSPFFKMRHPLHEPRSWVFILHTILFSHI